MANHSTTDVDGNIVLKPEALQDIISSAVQAATQAVLASIQTNSANDTAKARRPVISKGVSLEHWNFFVNKWAQYKSITGITASRPVNELLECCDDPLQLNLHRILGATIFQLDESTLINHIKCLAVKSVSIIVSRVEMREMTQQPNEDIHHFAARLRGQAEVCDFHVSCDASDCTAHPSYADEEIKTQLCVGINDPEIQQQLLMTDVEKQSLDSIINFFAIKEAGRTSHSTLQNTGTHSQTVLADVARVSTYVLNSNE